MKRLRIIIEIIVLLLVSLLFFGIGADRWGFVAKLQFLPAALRLITDISLLNIAVVAVLLAVTQIFGRIYCSTLCPLGGLQDIVIWLRRMSGKLFFKIRVDLLKHHIIKKGELKPYVKHFRYRAENKFVRRVILGVYVCALIVGIQSTIMLLAPYSTYGRILTSLVQGRGVWLAIANLAVIFICAWIGGRWWCNTLCPVGTILGLVARKPFFAVRIDGSKCSDCGRCERGCKSSCIDAKNHTIDYSRCVLCFDCISRCKDKAVTFGPVRHAQSETPRPVNEGRRSFLAVTALLAAGAGTATAREKLNPIAPKSFPRRSVPPVPPGARSVEHLRRHCTSCGLCISNCPNAVLRPSLEGGSIMQPEMNFEKGFCRPECTVCSEICPAGAILPIGREEKSATRIGTAVINRGSCLASKGRRCSKCASECPSGAIRMLEIDGKRQPVVNEELCIGCGKCEYLCPVRPQSAIIVEGIKVHVNG